MIKKTQSSLDYAMLIAIIALSLVAMMGFIQVGVTSYVETQRKSLNETIR